MIAADRHHVFSATDKADVERQAPTVERRRPSVVVDTAIARTIRRKWRARPATPAVRDAATGLPFAGRPEIHTRSEIHQQTYANWMTVMKRCLHSTA